MKKLHCSCGKMLARYENGVLYLWCKNCKREIPVELIFSQDTPKLLKNTNVLNSTKIQL